VLLEFGPWNHYSCGCSYRPFSVVRLGFSVIQREEPQLGSATTVKAGILSLNQDRCRCPQHRTQAPETAVTTLLDSPVLPRLSRPYRDNDSDNNWLSPTSATTIVAEQPRGRYGRRPLDESVNPGQLIEFVSQQRVNTERVGQQDHCGFALVQAYAGSSSVSFSSGLRT